MQQPFRALTRNFRLIRLRKFRGQQSTGPARDGEIRVVSVKCLMSLNSHLLRPRWTSPPCFSFTRFIMEQCLLKMTSKWPLLTVWKLPGQHIVLNTADTRHTVMPWRIPFSPELFHIGIVCLLLCSIPSTQRSLGHSLFKQKISQKCFECVFCCYFCLFFTKSFKISTPWRNAQVWAKPVR